MIRTDKEIFSQEAYYYFQDGLQELRNNNQSEAKRYFDLAESYLKDANIKYTGTGKDLKWSE